jgi:hypothetical protein
LEEAELIPFKEILPFSFIELMSGFKYLGYHLKLGASKTEEWISLVSTLEKKIGHWLNKWLSLAGRYVLVKTVLESQTVF